MHVLARSHSKGQAGKQVSNDLMVKITAMYIPRKKGVRNY